MDDKIVEVIKRYDAIEKLVLDRMIEEMDELLETYNKGDSQSKEECIHNSVVENTIIEMENMANEPQEGLDGKSMNEYFLTLESNQLFELLDYVATELDVDNIPGLIKAIASLSDRDKVIETVTDKVFNCSWTEEEFLKSDRSEDSIFEMEFNKVRLCFEVLKKMEYSALIEKVTDKFLSYDMVMEFVAETVAYYISYFPDVSIPLLIDRINSNLQNGLIGPYEDLVVILTNISTSHEEYKSDDIYKTLKNGFRYMEDKVYAVMCLGDYGDNRAIPMLKGYVERPQDTIEKEVFYEIISTLQKLGADISDIRDPFSGFDEMGNINSPLGH